MSSNNTSDFKSFHYLENGEVSFSILDTIKTEQKLDSGVYTLEYLPYPEMRVKLDVSTDKETIKTYSFPDKDKLDNLFDSFFNENVVKKVKGLGFYHKVGVLLYGKEGTGKSTIIKSYANKVLEKHNGLVFYFTSNQYVNKCWDFIRKIREIQDNPIVVVFEEMDMYTQKTQEVPEGYLKTILDGNNSIDNCIILGATNYIDTIPKAIKDRPSRFKYVLNIEGIHSEEEILDILSPMISDICGKDEIKEYAYMLKGETLDSIKQFAMDKIMCLQSYSKNKKTMGFSPCK
jgi:SpoVK/Ycf46/Vps4 family AAA+-type ATPase